jgi:hypothetical protein
MLSTIRQIIAQQNAVLRLNVYELRIGLRFFVKLAGVSLGVLHLARIGLTRKCVNRASVVRLSQQLARFVNPFMSARLEMAYIAEPLVAIAQTRPATLLMYQLAENAEKQVKFTIGVLR